MATSTLQVDAPTKSRWLLRSVLLFFAVVLIAAGAVLGWLYVVARSALPTLDGSIRVAALSAPVTVTRDTHGVPTIEATSLDDLFFAQGYITAQDRLWQMDIMRRYAGGEISEILGPKFIAHDREQRILGLRVAARHALQSASARDRTFFEDYTRGVNAYINTHLHNLPLEFRILRYSPKIWTAEDSMLMGARMVQDLNHYSYQRALDHEKILAKLGPELTADLYVNSSWRDHPPSSKSPRMDDEEQDDSDSGADSSVANKSLPALLSAGSAAEMQSAMISGLRGPEDDSNPDYGVLFPGSNDWVVSGDHTVTGKPLLSNDMHLGHQMPNLWYEAHLRGGNLDVVGVTLPGTPFVIVGHNQRIAWGFTNVGPTVEDVYVEKFNDSGQYLTPSGWIQPEHRQEMIHVKGAPDVMLDVVSTRHGPIITELAPGETRKLALRWTLYDSLADPFFDVDSAQNWKQFREALSTWDSPSQNAVYGDVDGHIGYQATGHIPIRAAGDGSLPVDGSDNTHEWTGYIPFEELPHVYDPPTGIIATANGRITPDNYKFSISTEWGSPWRTDRIYRVLESGKKFAASDMLELQTDIYSAFDRFCAERLVYALDHAANLSPRAMRARELLRDWDGRLTADSAGATIAVVARQKLIRLLLEPKLGAAPNRSGDAYDSEEGAISWKNYRWFMSSVWLENVLLKQPKRWLPENYSNYDALLAAAVEAAVKSPEGPAKIDDWKWGRYSPIDIEHPLFSQIPLLGRWTAPGVREQSGGGYTVKQVGRSFGPSERMTVDLADLNRTTLNTVTGQGGNLLSPFYMDQWNAWYSGSTFPVPFSSDAVRETRTHELRLVPER